MYDRFIERLSVSKYKDNFILKGGFYLSTLFGVENRTTMDIDTTFRNANFNEETIVKMIKEKFHIDIATGDPITPKKINYKYKPIMGDRYVKLWTYNIETVLAEKIETVLSRVELNGRMRDFYDIYLIYTKDWSNINLEHFIKAIEKTFYKREYIGDPFVALNIIKNSEVLKERWNKYQKTFSYVRGMNFDEIMECLEKLIEQLETVGV